MKVRYIGAAGELVREDTVEEDFSVALSHAAENRPPGAVEERIYDGNGRFVIRNTITGGHYSGDSSSMMAL